MKEILPILLIFACGTSAQASPQEISADDAVRVHEFYRLAEQVQNKIWPGWDKVPAPVLLVTTDREFLTHHPQPPAGFTKVGEGFYTRARQFPANLLATFPAFGPPSVIVIGEPKNTTDKTSTPWLITLMHEHFHQLQNAQAGYFQAVEDLGLSRGDKSGMWMLNFPFPYEQPEVAQAFAKLRDSLLLAVNEKDESKFAALSKQYAKRRAQFFASLAPDERKYFNLQLWQEGIARYTQIKVAEAAEHYQPTAEFAKLPDYTPFSKYSMSAEADTLHELKRADLAQWKRTVVYSLGATEGLLLDRMNPAWKSDYLAHPFSLEFEFQAAKK
jgi:hypothetical protein